jgi:hypothetical protein
VPRVGGNVFPVEPDDAYWRRPAESDPGPAQGASPFATGSPPPVLPDVPKLIYQGPPVSAAPPADWRPQQVVEPVPPRQLPEQDHAAIDDRESRARTLTVGLAIVAGAVMLIVLCAVCGRSLF